MGIKFPKKENQQNVSNLIEVKHRWLPFSPKALQILDSFTGPPRDL